MYAPERKRGLSSAVNHSGEQAVSALAAHPPLAGTQGYKRLGDTMEITYDPDNAPSAEQWMMMDEGERIQMVLAYHDENQISLPNPQLHAVIHVTVENQAAMGDEIPVAGHLGRLMEESLGRHEAIHAIGSVLAEHLYTLMKDQSSGEDVNQAYYEGLKELTAKKWLGSGSF
jgi:hypothetical protein